MTASMAGSDDIGLDRDGAMALSADRKSTRLNSSHSQISYAVFCLKKKLQDQRDLGWPGRVAAAVGLVPDGLRRACHDSKLAQAHRDDAVRDSGSYGFVAVLHVDALVHRESLQPGCLDCAGWRESTVCTGGRSGFEPAAPVHPERDPSAGHVSRTCRICRSLRLCRSEERRVGKE